MKFTLAAVVAAVLFVSGCSGGIADNDAGAASSGTGSGTDEGLDQGAGSGAESGERRPSRRPTAGADGVRRADAVADAIEAALRDLAAESPRPNRQQLRDALRSAAPERGPIEVSADRTPTGLEVEAIQGAVPVGGECVVGYVRDGAVTVTVLPLLETGRCFVGD